MEHTKGHSGDQPNNILSKSVSRIYCLPPCGTCAGVGTRKDAQTNKDAQKAARTTIFAFVSHSGSRRAEGDAQRCVHLVNGIRHTWAQEEGTGPLRTPGPRQTSTTTLIRSQVRDISPSDNFASSYFCWCSLQAARSSCAHWPLADFFFFLDTHSSLFNGPLIGRASPLYRFVTHIPGSWVRSQRMGRHIGGSLAGEGKCRV